MRGDGGAAPAGRGRSGRRQARGGRHRSQEYGAWGVGQRGGGDCRPYVACPMRRTMGNAAAQLAPWCGGRQTKGAPVHSPAAPCMARGLAGGRRARAPAPHARASGRGVRNRREARLGGRQGAELARRPWHARLRSKAPHALMAPFEFVVLPDATRPACGSGARGTATAAARATAAGCLAVAAAAPARRCTARGEPGAERMVS